MKMEHLYEVYETTRANQAMDLTIGLAMFKAEHPEIQITQEEDRAMREFMGRYGQELAAAFPNREKFQAAVEAGLARDALLEQERLAQEQTVSQSGEA